MAKKSALVQKNVNKTDTKEGESKRNRQICRVFMPDGLSESLSEEEYFSSSDKCFCEGGGCVCEEINNCQSGNFKGTDAIDGIDEEDFRFGEPSNMAIVREEAFGTRTGNKPKVFCPRTGERSGKAVPAYKATLHF